MRKIYELTENGCLRPSKDDDKEVKILNRIARWTAGGAEYEADPRQAERLVSDLGLDGAKRVGTPGVKQTFEMTSRDKHLAVEKHTVSEPLPRGETTWASVGFRCSTQPRKYADGWLPP